MRLDGRPARRHRARAPRIADLGFPIRRDGAVEVSDDHLKQHDAERVEVALRLCAFAFDAFGGHVQQRSRFAAGAGGAQQRRAAARHRPLAKELLSGDAADAEIGELDAGGAGGDVDEDVLRFEVLVDDAGAVGGVESVGDLRRDFQLRADRQRREAALFLQPHAQAVALHEFHAEVERRLFEVDLHQPDDAGVVADLLADQAKERQLALERARLLFEEAELEHAILVAAHVPGEPDFPEAPLAEFFDDGPIGAGEAALGGGAPAELLLGDVDGPRLFRGRGRAQDAAVLLADLADLDRILDALDDVRAVRHPREGPDAFEVAAHQHLPGVVEDGAAAEDLAAAGQRHDARGGVDLEAVEVVRAARALVHDDFAEVDADAHLQRRRLGREGDAHARLHSQRAGDGVGGAGEDAEERVAGGGDLLGVVEFGEDLADDVLVRLQQLDGAGVAELLLEARRSLDVREQQRQQRRAVLLAEALDAGARVGGFLQCEVGDCHRVRSGESTRRSNRVQGPRLLAGRSNDPQITQIAQIPDFLSGSLRRRLERAGLRPARSACGVPAVDVSPQSPPGKGRWTLSPASSDLTNLRVSLSPAQCSFDRQVADGFTRREPSRRGGSGICVICVICGSKAAEI